MSGALSGVTVTVTPSGANALPAATSGSGGAYAVASVPVGGGTVSVSGVPTGCTAPSPTSYTGLAEHQTMTVNIQVTCVTPTGTISGTIISSVGSALIANATVVATPNGGSALPSVKTNASGVYTVSNVPVANGTGTVALSTLPSNCTTPSPTAYSGLTSSHGATVNITVTCTPTTGGLTVTVVAQPGVPVSVHVAGPGGYSQTVTATQTLTGLAPGSYTLTASGGSLTDPIVSTTYAVSVSGSPASIVAGQTATATVTYNSAGTGGLWITNFASGTITELTAGQMRASGSPAAADSILPRSPYSFGSAQGLAVDHSGNLWVAVSQNSVIELTPAQLTAGGTITPATTIFLAPNFDPGGLAFDASGNMWVADRGTNGLYEIAPSQFVSNTAPLTPTVQIQYLTAGGFKKVAFDPSGNLWALTMSTDQLVEYTPSQLATGGNLTPAVIISANAGSIDFPIDLAFDASGNAWVSNALDSTIVEFTPSQLAASGSPVPTTTLTVRASGPFLSTPGPLAFDNSGNLWVGGDRNEVMEYTASQLAVGGPQAPTLRVSGSAFNDPWGLAFDPHSTALPLH